MNHPFVARNNPERADSIPAGFERHRITVTAALPIPLPVTIRGVDATMMLALPSGRIRGWLALDVDAIIAAGADQRARRDPALTSASAFAAARARASPLLMIMIDRALADVWPLALGGRHLIEKGRAGARRAICELIVLDFQLTAGSVTTARPGGSWIDLAIRPLGATDAFQVPMVRNLPQQTALARNPDDIPLVMRFDSVVSAAPPPDGTPVGGMNWWLAYAHA